MSFLSTSATSTSTSKLASSASSTSSAPSAPLASSASSAPSTMVQRPNEDIDIDIDMDVDIDMDSILMPPPPMKRPRSNAIDFTSTPMIMTMSSSILTSKSTPIQRPLTPIVATNADIASTVILSTSLSPKQKTLAPNRHRHQQRQTNQKQPNRQRLETIEESQDNNDVSKAESKDESRAKAKDDFDCDLEHVLQCQDDNLRTHDHHSKSNHHPDDEDDLDLSQSYHDQDGDRMNQHTDGADNNLEGMERRCHSHNQSHEFSCNDEEDSSRNTSINHHTNIKLEKDDNHENREEDNVLLEVVDDHDDKTIFIQQQQQQQQRQAKQPQQQQEHEFDKENYNQRLKSINDNRQRDPQKQHQQYEDEKPQQFDKPPIQTRFSDIIGHGQAKLRLDEMLLPLALPPSLAASILKGVRAVPASILLYGPPGTGKTQLAKAVAGEAQAAFMSIGPSDILSNFVGESEQSIKILFESAMEKANRMESKCTVLFFDEIDALGMSRNGNDGGNGGGGSSNSGDGGSNVSAGGGGEHSSRRILAELLIQLSKLSSSSRDDSQDSSSTSTTSSSDSDSIQCQTDIQCFDENENHNIENHDIEYDDDTNDNDDNDHDHNNGLSHHPCNQDIHMTEQQQGSHQQGSHQQGSHQQGSHQQGSHQQGSHQQGSQQFTCNNTVVDESNCIIKLSDNRQPKDQMTKFEQHIINTESKSEIEIEDPQCPKFISPTHSKESSSSLSPLSSSLQIDNHDIQQLNETNSKPRIIVIAATNRPEDCDPALLRRFSIRVLIGLPSHRDRKRIIQRLLEDIEHTITSQQLCELSRSLETWSGSDLESVTREAVMAPVRECLRSAAIMKMKAKKNIVYESNTGNVNQRRGSSNYSSNKNHCNKNNGCIGKSKRSSSVDAIEFGNEMARHALMHGFRNLRPVSIHDFDEAVSFWIGDGQDQMTEQMMIHEAGVCHYDSESSEDE